MTKYVYTQVMDVPKGSQRWFIKKHHDLIFEKINPEGLLPKIKTLVDDKGGTMNVDTVELNSTHVRITVRTVFNTVADRDAYEAYVASTEEERSAYETAEGITHTKTKTEEAE
jgi:hypothetical protein